MGRGTERAVVLNLQPLFGRDLSAADAHQIGDDLCRRLRSAVAMDLQPRVAPPTNDEIFAFGLVLGRKPLSVDDALGWLVPQRLAIGSAKEPIGERGGIGSLDPNNGHRPAPGGRQHTDHGLVAGGHDSSSATMAMPESTKLGR